MAFLKSLFNRLKPGNDIKAVTDSSDHYDILERLRAEHEWIEVKVTKTDKLYQSMVLTIDIDNHELIIDDLFPPPELQTIAAGDTVEISSHTRRANIHFFTRILDSRQRDGSNCYHLELPEDVGLNHSRGSYRAYVESEQNLLIDIAINGEQLQGARLINLSEDGLKLRFAEDVADLIQKNKFLEDCLLRLPSGIELDCDIALSHIYRMRKPYPHTLAGGRLTVRQPQQRLKLQQYLASVQRKQRRMETQAI